MVERRQELLAENALAIERWHKKLFRASNELQKLVAARRRLLKPRAPGGKLKLHEPTGIGGGMLTRDVPNDEIGF